MLKSTTHRAPELLAPAGSLDAVRAAVANGADAVYLGVGRFNARDDGAQLSFDELALAVGVAHDAGVRVYLTLNTLVKPGELVEALTMLGEAVDRGIDAAIVQDIGLIRLIRTVYPSLEIHGSTQMTVHDVTGARLAAGLGIERVVLARENTIEDVRAIRHEVPEIGLETFVHGALCISYSGQCLMSGMISERSANRGSCAQACRKDYVLTDAATQAELDRGFLISAKDLAAHDVLASLAEIGVGCFKVEGRKKKPEYVATVTRAYRGFLDRVAGGHVSPPTFEEVRPLVQIYSRGFTTGMYSGRAGREYITRDHPDNRGHEIGVVVGRQNGHLVIDSVVEVRLGDGLAFEPPPGTSGTTVGFTVEHVALLSANDGRVQQTIGGRNSRGVSVGWRVVRSAEAALLRAARESFVHLPLAARRTPVDVRLFGAPGAPLKAVWVADGETLSVQSGIPLTPAQARPLSDDFLRDHLGRLGGTPFMLRDVDVRGLAAGLFLPVSELNHLRQEAVDELLTRREWHDAAAWADREGAIANAVADLRSTGQVVSSARAGAVSDAQQSKVFGLVTEVYQVDDARVAAAHGATEVVFDPFLRHPTPPAARVRDLAQELAAMGVSLRLRLPTIVRPEERRTLEKWLALDTPILSGHSGLAVDLAASGRDVVGDYALNVFNQHAADEFFVRGVRRLTASVELTVEELGQLVEPWQGNGFEVVIYGRPEGMTLEHCVLSAAFDRVATTCRDLCVKKHPVVDLTDPAGYTFPVATDSACRNRLLHSRPVDGSEFVPRLWKHGIRHFRLLFNVPGLPVADLVQAYGAICAALAAGDAPDVQVARHLMHDAFTRGHFARAV